MKPQKQLNVNACHAELHLPPAIDLASATASTLNAILHRQQSGGLRHGSSHKLHQALRLGAVTVSDVSLSVRPDLDDNEIASLLPDSQSGRYSAAHRRLELHGHLLAHAWADDSPIIPEAPVTGGRHPLRADVALSLPGGDVVAIEAGATNALRIVAMLNVGVGAVVVLPYAGLHADGIRGYAFRSTGRRALPPLSASDLTRALARLTTQPQLY